MLQTENKLTRNALESVRAAASNQAPIDGLTHRFYRYPARFSPVFARGCIEAFSKPGDIVLDPYMGGATSILEAFVLGRQAIGSDLNSLSVFIARVKASQLSRRESLALENWAILTVPTIRCHDAIESNDRTPRNMNLAPVRWLRKTIAVCLDAAEKELPTRKTVAFARCVLLNVGQWALNGRKRLPTAQEFRERVTFAAFEMLLGAAELAESIASLKAPAPRPVLRQNDAERIDLDAVIRDAGRADLVVTSPPYPGIHMLYHRWQVDGRKETDAPYWIAACNDGAGASFYNFADRRRQVEERYFEKAQRSFGAVRKIMRRGAILAQMVAFAEPDRQLDRYMDTMTQAGFRELNGYSDQRIWRVVPSRRWHATTKGSLASSKEIVLLHEAI